MKHTEETAERVCYDCRGTVRGHRKNYLYTECGLKHVVLKDVMVFQCKRCGSESVEIPNMDGLHRTIALSLLRKTSLLSGDEIRFLRKVSGYTGTELAKNLGVTKVAVSRWENGGKIGGQSDRSVRVLCGLSIIEEIVAERTGAVDVEHVRQSIEKLKEFLVQFNPKKILPSIKEEVCESGRLMIDPAHPTSVGFLPQIVKDSPAFVN
jgi:putative transcriptional regulator